MSLLQFFAGEESLINDVSGSGLAFFAAGGFGSPQPVGFFNDNTYVSNSDGNVNGIKVNNVKYVHINSGQIPVNDTRLLRDIPNYLATLNIRFTHTSPVRLQNSKLRIFNRSDINVGPTDVITQVAVLIHPSNTIGPTGSGATSWVSASGSGSVVSFADYPATVSPGSGGYSPSGGNTQDVRHDFFVAISMMPLSIGGKNAAIYFSTEFL